MKEKLFYISQSEAHALLEMVEGMEYSHRGIDRRAYLFDDYAVLKTDRLKLRNVDTRDDDLKHFDSIIKTLHELRALGTNVVEILGYCYDESSADGCGYIFERRAKGSELYLDAALCRLHVWTQGMDADEIYLKSSIDPAEHILTRTRELAAAPQEHFDRFVRDVRTILSRELLIDFTGKSNFFYDPCQGFQFIDIDAHTDSYYGLSEARRDDDEAAALGAFVPCHFARGTKAFASVALDDGAVAALGEAALRSLRRDNLTIFEKCRTAIISSGIEEKKLADALSRLKIFGR